MFVEGQFPVFPWLGLFLLGYLCGRWCRAVRLKHLAMTADLFMLVFVVPGAVSYGKPRFAHNNTLYRFFIVTPNFYPAFPPIMCLLVNLVIYNLAAAAYLDRKKFIKGTNLFVSLGHCSLSVFFAHIILVREAAHRFGFWCSFSTAGTSLIMIAMVIGISLLAILWSSVNFKFGLEWAVKKVSERVAGQ